MINEELILTLLYEEYKYLLLTEELITKGVDIESLENYSVNILEVVFDQLEIDEKDRDELNDKFVDVTDEIDENNFDSVEEKLIEYLNILKKKSQLK